MTFSLFWSKTGDTIDLSPVQSDILEWWIEQVNQHDCNRLCSDNPLTLWQKIQTLRSQLEIVNARWNQWFKKDFFQCRDLIDQQELNNLHREWVLIQKNKPNLLVFLNRMDPETCESFVSINRLLHIIENEWKWEFHPVDNRQWYVPNPFGVKHNIWYRPNISIDYGNLGRSSQEKYHTWGEIDDEYNEMEMISGILHINFHRPGTILPSPDFQDWCQEKQVPCYPNIIPLANFKNLEEHQYRYRRIFIDNLTLDNNYLTLCIK